MSNMQEHSGSYTLGGSTELNAHMEPVGQDLAVAVGLYCASSVNEGVAAANTEARALAPSNGPIAFLWSVS